MKFSWPWSKKKAEPQQKKYASLEEEIADLRKFYSGSHPNLTDDQWAKASIKLAEEAEREYKDAEAMDHWKRVAALGLMNDKLKDGAMARIRALQAMSQKDNWEVMAKRSVKFAEECEKKGDKQGAIRHWRRVSTIAPKKSDMWVKANLKLSK